MQLEAALPARLIRLGILLGDPVADAPKYALGIYPTGDARIRLTTTRIQAEDASTTPIPE